jgi:predicted nucleotidyltransferase component of viral defense system
MIGYPLSFRELSIWSAENSISIGETRVRFAQYGVLMSVAQSRTLRDVLVFKGGNALDFVWQPNRSTTDLDFSVDMTEQTSVVDATTLRMNEIVCATVDVAIDGTHSVRVCTIEDIIAE